MNFERSVARQDTRDVGPLAAYMGFSLGCHVLVMVCMILLSGFNGCERRILSSQVIDVDLVSLPGAPSGGGPGGGGSPAVASAPQPKEAPPPPAKKAESVPSPPPCANAACAQVPGAGAGGKGARRHPHVSGQADG